MTFLFRLILIVIAVGIIVVISLGVAQETYRREQIQKEIEDLRVQAEKKERENQKLQGLIDYFQTSDFKEKEAKETLSVQKEGENVVLVKEPTFTEKEKLEMEEERAETEAKEAIIKKEDNRSNLRKWWDYFFATG
jgi:cell division protein FtsL